MTPKEKCEELFNKYYDVLSDNDIYIGITNNSKKCALIAVIELIQSYSQYLGMYDQELFNSERKYWEQVKEEINKL